MFELLQRNFNTPAVAPTVSSLSTDTGVIAGWRDGLTIVNLRCDAGDPAVQEAVSSVLGFRLPVQPCTCNASDIYRALWAGPDDWFIVGPRGQAEDLSDRLRGTLAGTHHSVTDVSSGYMVLHMGGKSARDVLSQGCPIDLHPREFSPGVCVGSQFFKASVWLWQTDDAPVYELLVRRSFKDYAWLMIERASAECGLIIRKFA